MATVLVRVKLLRRRRVERGRRRWVGVRRGRILSQIRTILPGVILRGICTSTPTTQTSPAAMTINVSAPLFAHPVPTKTKVGNPLAKHVPMVLTALLVPQVVHIPQLLVLLEPMPVVQTPFVIHVVLGNIMTKQVKRLNQ